jgi:hypothetical protein
MIFYLLSLSFGLKIISKASLNNQENDEYEIGRWRLWRSACLAFDIRVCLMGDLPPKHVPYSELEFCHFEGSPKTGPPVELVF